MHGDHSVRDLCMWEEHRGVACAFPMEREQIDKGQRPGSSQSLCRRDVAHAPRACPAWQMQPGRWKMV